MSPEPPPSFPRIPRLTGGGDLGDDRVAEAGLVRELLREPVVVEEKLDGMNVAVWLDGAGWPVVAGRSGKTQGDRGGQLGRVKTWLGEHAEAVKAVIEPGGALYGEWLGRVHSVVYDALPDWLVVLDLWTTSGGFAVVSERDRQCREAGLATPPIVFEGRLGSLAALEGLHGVSCFGSGAAEGLVLRREVGGRLVDRVKWIAPGFSQKSDSEWRGDARENRLRRG